MGVTPPGWYEDQDDPRLARWWDGERWTDHTLVIAEQVPHVQPPPPPGYEPGAGSEAFLGDEDTGWSRLDEGDWDPAAGATAAGAASVFADDADHADEPAQTSVFALDEDEAPPLFGGSWEAQEPLPRRRGLADQVRALPPWLLVAVAAAIILLLVVALAALGGGGDDGDGGDADATGTTVLDPVRVRSAALLAVRVADLPSLTTSTFTDLIPLTCEAAREDDARELAQEVRDLDLDEPTTDRLLVGLEAGAEDYCPEDMEGSDIIDQVYRRLGIVPSGTSVLATTSSSSSTSTSTTEAPATTRAPTTTRRTTTTTSPPATTSTTAATTTSTTTATTSPSTTPPPSSTTTSQP